MTEIKEVTDDRGNRCTVAHWGSIEAATAALATLKDCKNCSNCSYCSRCSGCSKECIIGPMRSDGYTFFLSPDKHIHAGCRDFATFAAGREHWNKTRGGTKLGIETECILQCLEQLAGHKENGK